MFYRLVKPLKISKRLFRMATNCDNDLNFRGGNPGAVQYGNFINYYQFHSPKDRIDSLPTDVWIKHDPFVVLDVGCNAGDLTIALYDFISSNISKNCYILGIDIDPVLVQRANENNINSNIKFICLDFMNIKDRNCVVSNYLESVSATRFSACFCFFDYYVDTFKSWGHWFKNFLKDVCVISDMVIIEPQPWKCYKSAVKRMKSYNYEFLQYNNLKIRNKVEEEIENIFMQINGVSKVKETGNSSWGRKISVFKVSQ